ncbi:hypothetical protein LEP1GSC021_4365 [Leptospira noguchii str. 1993005606]|uniref:Uncharacterized protein n=2 Tax=Leptospira noguchii TaxID=28182 RepID=M6U546_9LEPT|nr:hypothetical protein LEP1GSC041_0667 [Leptospira noguchii str. 2006001870]EMM98303.1 hypothetical protein LEP1GSC035_0629 [Leptospira noguchii str. 2007001578]EMO39605.1 hypothetical protein LEP1GSC186_1023 [Leptospira noguchii serovar Autumnalis str. ZUN142]EMS82736.1 hypothetical protein LEP1GSC074_0512 [Leptospira noguchii str. Hook]EPE86182.1 hypothetical protein LEP1GSC021_4365 [Leptospira noguchii str. 1993005606]
MGPICGADFFHFCIQNPIKLFFIKPVSKIKFNLNGFESYLKKNS